MIILHKGKDLYGIIHTGYVVYQEKKYYIIDLQEHKYEVDKNTIEPIIGENAEYRLENFPDIFGLSLRNALKSQHVYTLNDLRNMSDKDLLNTRGIGVIKLARIKELLDQYNDRL